MKLAAQQSKKMDEGPGIDAERLVEVRADGYQAVREAHRSEIVEDYVELIGDLIAEAGEARPVDIATRMGVTQPTVSKNLARLKREGFITPQHPVDNHALPIQRIRFFDQIQSELVLPCYFVSGIYRRDNLDQR